MQNDFYEDRDIKEEGYVEGDIVRVEFEDGENWSQAIVVDNGFGKLVIKNMENEFMIAYPEKGDEITLVEESTVYSEDGER